MRSTGESILAIALMALCCALPLLFVGGVTIGTGVLFREVALVVIGIGVLGFAIYKVARARRGTGTRQRRML